VKKFFQNKFLLFSVLGGIIVFCVVAFVVMNATATTNAVVLTEYASSGTTITESMVEEIKVPKETPSGFYQSKESIIGERLTTNVDAGQLIYPTNIMANVNYSTNTTTNEEYVTTCVKVANDNALGGLLTAGDFVDIGIIPTGSTYELATFLPGFEFDASVEGGFYFILANVEILDTTTSVSNSQGSTASAVIDGTSSDEESAYYFLSLSYNDYKKLRIAQQFGDLYFNLVPSQNDDNDPLLKQMTSGVIGGLTNSVDGKDYNENTYSTMMDEDGNLITVITDKDGNKTDEDGNEITFVDEQSSSDKKNSGNSSTSEQSDNTNDDDDSAVTE
jgi:Flp pilus assembly protein CpaB